MAWHKQPIIRSDKYWRKTGTIFIETAKDGKPSGLDVAASDYVSHLLDSEGNVVVTLTFNATKLRQSLVELAAAGEIHHMIADNDTQTTGYLVPLHLVSDLLQKMAGKDVVDEFTASKNKTPIVITTDGSYRTGGHGGGHVILERRGSDDVREDFRINLTWQATIKDSYESEARGVLEALKYLEHGRKNCDLIIRCDNMGVVNTVNEMRDALKATGDIPEIPHNKPLHALWQEVADMIKFHSFNAEYARYNAADPNTVECHNGANKASEDWKGSVKKIQELAR